MIRAVTYFSALYGLMLFSGKHPFLGDLTTNPGSPALPPFHRTVAVDPQEGLLVLFPGWLVSASFSHENIFQFFEPNLLSIKLFEDVFLTFLLVYSLVLMLAFYIGSLCPRN